MVVPVIDKSTEEFSLFLLLDAEIRHHHHHQDVNKVVPVNFSPEYSGGEDDNLSENTMFYFERRKYKV